MPPTDIDNGAKTREVIGSQERSGTCPGCSRHTPIEDLRRLRMLGDIVINACAPHMGKRGLAGLDGIEEGAVGAPDPLLAIQNGRATYRARHVRLQIRRGGGEGKALLLLA